MTDISQIKTFVRGGNARFTLVSKATGARVTFRVRASDDGKVHFVKVLTGADNTNSYTFLGTIFQDGTYRRGFRSPIGEDAPSAKAFVWFFDHVAQGDVAKVEFWHEGRCGRCGRVLTVPESIATGFGPECAGRVGAVTPDMRTTRTDDRGEIPSRWNERMFEGEEFERVPGTAPAVTTSQTVREVVDQERADDYHEQDDDEGGMMTDAEETVMIQRREREEEVERMNRKLGLPRGYRPQGWLV